MSDADTKNEDNRLAEVAREIYRLYGNNLQRYFDDVLRKTDHETHKPKETTSRCVDADSFKRMMDVRKNASYR